MPGTDHVQFVDTGSSSSKSSVASPKQSKRGGGLSINELTNSSMAETEITLTEAGQPSATEYFDSSTPRANSFEQPPPTLNTPVPGPTDTSPSNAAYETALNVLLSLGTGTDHTGPSVISTPRPREGVCDYFPTFQTPNFDENATLATPITELTEQFSTCALLPQNRVVQLLRHYRYNIAPWVSNYGVERT